MTKLGDREGILARELETSGAYPLFDEHGRSEIGIGFLEQRVLEWSYGLVLRGARSDTRLPGTTAEDRLLSIFDIFHQWFQREDYEAAAIIDTMLDLADGVRPVQGRVDYLQEIRAQLVTYATEVNISEPTEFALSWHVLMKGAIFAAVEGDQDAALRAKQMARGLISAYSPVTKASPEWFDYDHAQLDARAAPVVLYLDTIGDDLVEYETAARWFDQGLPSQ